MTTWHRKGNSRNHCTAGTKSREKNPTLTWKASAKSTGRPPIKGALAQREENHARAFTAITKF